MEELRLGDEFFTYAAHRLKVYAQWLEEPDLLKEVDPMQTQALSLSPELVVFLACAEPDAGVGASADGAEDSGGDDFKRGACRIQELLETLEAALPQEDSGKTKAGIDEKMAASLEALRALYLNKGYINFNITNSSLNLSEDKQHIFVEVSVDEGEQFKFGESKFLGDAL